METLTLECSPDNLVQTFRKVMNIVRVEARHRDAAIAGKMDMRLLSEREALLCVQTRKAVRIVSTKQRSEVELAGRGVHNERT